MTEYFVSGGNSGLAQGLISILSKTENVQYFARTKNHKLSKKVKYNRVDFSKAFKDADLKFKISNNTKEIVFFNNSAILGSMNNFSETNPKEITEVFSINFLSPIIIINKLIKISQKLDIKLTVVNITSGLTEYPVSHLTNYIVSKKAMMFFLKVLNLDIQNNSFYSLSIDPGMLNTDMQLKLRLSNISSSGFFIKKFNDNMLRDVNQVSNSIYSFLKQKKWKNEEIYHINEIEKLI